MEEDETVLSDVHALHPGLDEVIVGDLTYRTSKNVELSVKLALSRFPFDRRVAGSPADGLGVLVNATRCCHSDEDGDLDVQRRRDAHLTADVIHDVVTIEHSLASPLSLVGLQVWLGAMLLSDYILHLSDALSNSTVLELGAGTGLCSIVSSIFARRVICTDVGSDISSLCRRNVDRNRHLCRSRTREAVLVRELDWRNGFPPSSSSWSEDDLKVLDDCDVVLAADVIYDDHVTDSFFALLSRLLVGGGPKTRTLYLSLERRLNFTLSELDVSCPAYDHFLRRTEKLEQDSGVEVKKLSVNFRQSFAYARSKYLELWQMRSKSTSKSEQL